MDSAQSVRTGSEYVGECKLLSLREMGKGGGNRAGSEGPYEGRGIEKPRAKSAAVGKTLQETIFFKK